MDIEAELFPRLATAQGDSLAQAAIMAEFRLSAWPEPERGNLRDALDAAAVLHWFDPRLLTLVLVIPGTEAQTRYDSLTVLTFIEAYGRPELGQLNVHEATRLGWRCQLAAAHPARFRVLSARAAACFADDPTPTGRIEWVYHLLSSDPDAGEEALWLLNSEWGSSARPEDLFALLRMLDELATSGFLSGRIKAWTFLVKGEAAIHQGSVGELDLESATEPGDPAMAAEPALQHGRLDSEQGLRDEVQAAFETERSTNRALVPPPAKQTAEKTRRQSPRKLIEHGSGGLGWRITTKGRYAITAMLDLAINAGKGPTALADIAQRQAISLSYLEQLFAKLRRRALVTSVRGPGGGYGLARHPSEISVFEVIVGVDECMDYTRCRGRGDCQNGQPCLTHELWSDLSEHIWEYLTAITLQQLVNQLEGIVRHDINPSKPEQDDLGIPLAVIDDDEKLSIAWVRI